GRPSDADIGLVRAAEAKRVDKPRLRQGERQGRTVVRSEPGPFLPGQLVLGGGLRREGDFAVRRVGLHQPSRAYARRRQQAESRRQLVLIPMDKFAIALGEDERRCPGCQVLAEGFAGLPEERRLLVTLLDV